MTATTNTPPALDEDRLNALLGQAVGEFGAAANAALVVIGDRLGLYRRLAADGPLTAAEQHVIAREERPSIVDPLFAIWLARRGRTGAAR